MNIQHIESVVRRNVCPVCSIGTTKEIGRNIYQCSRSRCGEIFNFSLLSDAMINELLKREGEQNPGTKN